MSVDNAVNGEDDPRMQNPIVTVSDFKKLLAQLPDELQVVAMIEDEHGSEVFGIHDVSMSKVTPQFNDAGHLVFRFDNGETDVVIISLARE